MEKVKWYFNPVVMIFAILLLGPFAIPLIWMHPSMKMAAKMLVIILTLAITVWMCMVTVDIFKQSLKNIQEMQKTLGM